MRGAARRLWLVLVPLSLALAASGCVTPRLYEATIGGPHTTPSRAVSVEGASVVGTDPDSAEIYLRVGLADGGRREYRSGVEAASYDVPAEALPRSSLPCVECRRDADGGVYLRGIYTRRVDGATRPLDAREARAAAIFAARDPGGAGPARVYDVYLPPPEGWALEDGKVHIERYPPARGFRVDAPASDTGALGDYLLFGALVPFAAAADVALAAGAVVVLWPWWGWRWHPHRW
ncbi:MAG TPA: hypothetical protein VHF22_10705 [Planctomycetota bacterium]|nr:hypothetical protein [Planctomycetota bacterium]